MGNDKTKFEGSLIDALESDADIIVTGLGISNRSQRQLLRIIQIKNLLFMIQISTIQ